MKREIKFRVFFYDGKDYKTGKFLTAEEAFRENYIEFVGNSLQPTDECVIICEYTGKKDDAKNDIYDGDIMKCVNGQQEYNCLVHFEDGCFFRKLISDHKSFYHDISFATAQFHDEKWEIIGSQFENPELLK